MRTAFPIRILAVTLATVALPALTLLSGDPAAHSRWANEVDSWFIENKTAWNMPGTTGSGFSPDGRQAVLSLTNGGIALVDLRTRTTKSVIDFSIVLGHDKAIPGAIAVSPLGFIAAAFPERNEILLIDQAKMRISERIRTTFPPRSLRFSARGGYLFIGDSAERHSALAIYSIRMKQTVLSRAEPMICDMSRDDRYIYLLDAEKNSVRWITSDTMETVRYFPLTTLTPSGLPLTLRVLRDHSIALGFRGTLMLTDRYLGQAYLTHSAAELAVTRIEPSHDNRFVIFGDGLRHHVLSLDNNMSRLVPLPEDARNVSVYPGGNYLMYSDTRDKRTGIVRIDAPSRFFDASTTIDRK